MKNLTLVILVSFFIIGCSTKEVEIDATDYSKVIATEIKKDEIKKVVPLDIPKKEIILESEEFSNEISSENYNEFILNDEPILSEKLSIEIAVIYPSQRIGKYAKSTINTMIGFFTYKNVDYNIKVFDSKSEDEEALLNTFFELKESGIKKVIALYTNNGLNTINNMPELEGLEIYFPLINKDDLFETKDNFIYGGISHKKQLEKLITLSNLNNYMFYQNSYVGSKLKSYYEELLPQSTKVVEILRGRNNFKHLIKNENIDNKTVFLNTPIIKTSIILSQFNIYEKTPYLVLSTQLNYNPSLMTLTQEKDRLNFVMANSIDDIDSNLNELINLAGADVTYNWVNYSTLVGVNYLFDLNSTNLIKTQIIDNSVNYEPRLFVSTASGFLEIK